MPIIRVRDNEKSRWKRNVKQQQQQKKTKTGKSKGEHKLQLKGES